MEQPATPFDAPTTGGFVPDDSGRPKPVWESIPNRPQRTSAAQPRRPIIEPILKLSLSRSHTNVSSIPPSIRWFFNQRIGGMIDQ